ncbi:hypothetical protein NM208_g193 [Fusarium decemcellulare]|uniref:Uncharacterized protein n=1 Tax=Fusarium decemcellulare TaxID=57161 RepID=A0ACC1T0F6_9HYPO|nr:hypothetical protein NM208_g193 [Fusarium decemcellulare]
MASRKGPACDGCRLRKVKCHGTWPCTQCAHLNLRCNFTGPAERRKRRVRGGLVAQLRETSSNDTTLPRQIETKSTTNLSRDFFINLLPQFSQFVFPLNPIISPQEMQDAIANMDDSAEDAALVHAFAAITINRTRSSWEVHGELATLMANLVHRSMKAYRDVELESDDVQTGTLGPLPVTIKRVLTSIFLSVCVLTLGSVNRSFAILREGVTMLQTLHLHHRHPAGGDSITKWQRLYWEAYMHERHMALEVSFSGALSTLRTGLPGTDESIPPHIDLGFRRLVNLFLILDDNFVAHWRAQQDPTNAAPELKAEWVEQKQGQLDEDAACTAKEEACLLDRGLSGLSELQHIDLAITRLWLRTLVWQLALSGGLLCSAPVHEGLSLRFPVVGICEELLCLFNQLESVTSVGFHGMGMLKKLFEITSTIADVLTLPTSPEEVQQQEHVSRVKDLLFLVKFLLSFNAIPKQQREYLDGKLETLRNVYTTVDFSDFITTHESSTDADGAINPNQQLLS